MALIPLNDYILVQCDPTLAVQYNGVSYAICTVLMSQIAAYGPGMTVYTQFANLLPESALDATAPQDVTRYLVNYNDLVAQLV